MSIADLMLESTTEADLLLMEDTLSDEADMLTESLDASFEQPLEDDETNALQFFNQDQLDGVSDADLNNYHPDKTDTLNNMGVGGGVDAPKYSTEAITRSLLSEAADDGVEGDGAGAVDFQDQTVQGGVDLDDSDLSDMSDDLDDEDDDNLLDGLL
jgi:hypothetical protein